MQVGEDGVMVSEEMIQNLIASIQGISGYPSGKCTRYGTVQYPAYQWWDNWYYLVTGEGSVGCLFLSVHSETSGDICLFFRAIA